MPRLETESAKMATLLKCDQLCIRALIPESTENQPKPSAKETINVALHEQARNAVGRDSIQMYCYATTFKSDSSVIEGALVPHEDYEIDDSFGNELVERVLEDKLSTWVVLDGDFKGKVIRYTEGDAKLRRARVVGGYVLNHMVNVESSNMMDNVEFIIPTRGKHLKDGVKIRYYLVSIYPSIQSPGYGDVYIREVTFTASKVTVGVRTLCRAIEQSYQLEMEMQRNQDVSQTQQGYDYDYPEIDGR
jgi:hypothetical protein